MDRNIAIAATGLHKNPYPFLLRRERMWVSKGSDTSAILPADRRILLFGKLLDASARLLPLGLHDRRHGDRATTACGAGC
jgi:hypothetical protein